MWDVLGDLAYCGIEILEVARPSIGGFDSPVVKEAVFLYGGSCKLRKLGEGLRLTNSNDLTTLSAGEKHAVFLFHGLPDEDEDEGWNQDGGQRQKLAQLEFPIVNEQRDEQDGEGAAP